MLSICSCINCLYFLSTWICVDNCGYVYLHIHVHGLCTAYSSNIYCETYAWLMYAVRVYSMSTYLYDGFGTWMCFVWLLLRADHLRNSPVGTSDSCPMWLTLMTMFPINPDFPCTPSTIAALGSLPFGRPFCCGWVSWKEKMTDETSLERNSCPSTSPGYSWIWSALCFFFSRNYGEWSLSSILFSKAKLIYICMVKPWGPCRRYHFAARCRTTKHVEVQDDPCEATKIWGEPQWISDSAKKESAETGKARTWTRAGGSTKTACSLFAQKQSIIIDTQKWQQTYYV